MSDIRLRFEVTGSTSAECAKKARETAQAYFGDVFFDIHDMDVRPLVMTAAGPISWTADVTAIAFEVPL